MSAVVMCCLLLVGCGAARRPTQQGSAGPVSADAPSWARAGDSKGDDGSLFVCEGEGADEAEATEAARALCSAKICELCGVEVKSTVETHETLDKVEVERKVVETCRRVRKSEDQVRYRQAGCGPDGCRAWLQVFFGSEAEARECRAYADENFADSGQCEGLIEAFRSTPDLTAASFRTRVDLLNRAIIACAEIDVRPTPKLTALDEILWQGVVSPSALQQPKRPTDKSLSIAARLEALKLNQTASWKAGYAERAYRAIDRQPLLESKVFVDRIALIRDAMSGYESIMRAFEAVVDAEQQPSTASDTALVTALRALRPVRGRMTPTEAVEWAASELGQHREALKQPAIKAYLMTTFAAAPTDNVGRAALSAIASDRRAAEEEWRFVRQTMSACVRCAATLLDLPEHGGEQTRVARLVELSRVATQDTQLKAIQDVDPAFLLRAEPALEPTFAAKLFSYEWLEGWLQKLPKAFGRAAPHVLRDTYGFEPRWTLSTDEQQALTARVWRLLLTRADSMRCNELDEELTMLEERGVDTRPIQPLLCRCVSEPRTSGMRDLTELYVRLVAWGASCVTKGASR